MRKNIIVIRMSVVQLDNKITCNTVTATEYNLMIKSSLQSYFIIWRDGSTYYRRNAVTGQVDSGTNASTIIQGALDAVDAANGGIISIRAGTYVIPTPLTYAGNHLTIMGEGKRATTLQSTLGAGQNMFTFGTAGNTSYIFVRLRNLRLLGNGSEQHGVVWYNYTRDVLARSVDVEGFGGDGFHIEGSFGSSIYDCFLNANLNGITLVEENVSTQKPNAFMIQVSFIQGGTCGIRLNVGTSGDRPNTVWIDRCTIQSQSNDGILVEKYTNVQIINNYFEANGRDAIRFEHPTDQTERSRGCRIEDNIFNGAMGNYCINVYNGDNLFIYNNYYNGTVGGAGNFLIVLAATTQNTFIEERSGMTYGLTDARISGIGGTNNLRDVLGTAREFGTGTIPNLANTTGNIAHGLGETPDVVFALGDHEETRDLILLSKDAVNIAIGTGDGVNVTADRDVMWIAIVKY